MLEDATGLGYGKGEKTDNLTEHGQEAPWKNGFWATSLRNKESLGLKVTEQRPWGGSMSSVRGKKISVSAKSQEYSCVGLKEDTVSFVYKDILQKVNTHSPPYPLESKSDSGQARELSLQPVLLITNSDCYFTRGFVLFIP